MDIVNQLARHATLGAAPPEELAWLAAHGSLRQFAEGEVIFAKGQEIEYLYVVLSGHVAIFVDRGTGLHKVFEWREGDVTGLLPYSRLVATPGDVVAQAPTTVLTIHREHFPTLIVECHEVTASLVRKMLDRARVFTSSDLHDEKLAALGKLSAGLAHELNNPASAIERSAVLLEERLEEAEQAARRLGAARLSEAQLAAIEAVRRSCLAVTVPGVLSPIEQAEREEAITDWLADHNVDSAVAGPLAETAVTLEALGTIAADVGGPALEAALRSAAAGCSVRRLTTEITEAAKRISGLVTAVKGFTHMDQATVAESVDVAQSLSNTVAVLRSKAQSKAVAIAVKVDPHLPRARGFVGELNQIWGNLIDNALDAVPQSGRVEVTAGPEGQRVVVRIIDNGTGIPEAARARMFEPFFTTKPVGKGTGLGLDIVRRLVMHNDAQLEFESAPGRTVFSVSLPLAETAAGPRP